MDDSDCAIRDIDLGNRNTLRIKEFTLLQDEAGAVVWDAGLVLSHYLAHQHDQGRCPVSGGICLELGSGTGVVGLTAARLGAQQVYLTDLPHLVPYLRENIQLNGLGATCSAVQLEWGNPDHLQALRERELLAPGQRWRAPDLLLASDVVYTPATRAAFFATLAELMALPPRPSATPAQATAAAAAPAPSVSPPSAAAPAAPEIGASAAAAAAANFLAEPGPAGLPVKGQDPSGGNSVPQPESSRGNTERAGHYDAEADLGGAALTARNTSTGGKGGGGGGGGGCGQAGPVALLSYERRPGVEELPQLLARHGLVAEEVPMHELHPEWQCADIRVVRLHKRSREP